MLHRSLRLSAVVVFALVHCAVQAQTAGEDPGLGRRRAVAQSIAQWVADYESGRLQPSGPLRGEPGLQPQYARTARAADLLTERDAGAVTHLEALQKLLYWAEQDVDEAVAAAVLGVAAAGFDKSLVDRDAVVMRDLGHWVLMRTEGQAAWYFIMQTAAGVRPLASGPEDLPPIEPSLRVAALKLLGMKGMPVFRSAIEGALSDGDPRVRLAAVEAIEFQRRTESLEVLVRMLGVERHAIVSQALVRAVRGALGAGEHGPPPELRERAIRAAMRLFGRSGWRADTDLVDFVEEHPNAGAVPPLIDILARKSDPDLLEETVNRGASPLLRSRAHEALQGLTGAILPADRPDEWREFWRTEQLRIAIPERLPKRRAVVSTASAFFGIPVTGREIAFVIDTSGSMDHAFGGTVPPSRRAQREPGQPSRLDAAKAQLLQAVQVMPAESRYHLLTFATEVTDWTRKPVPPTPAATRSLVELLARMHADGGTNVYEGIVAALDLDELHFGQAGKTAVDELFLLSDGEPTEGSVKDPEEILKLVAAANRYQHVRINTVFTGRGPGASFLRRLAEQNDGVFVQR